MVSCRKLRPEANNKISRLVFGTTPAIRVVATKTCTVIIQKGLKPASHRFQSFFYLERHQTAPARRRLLTQTFTGPVLPLRQRRQTMPQAHPLGACRRRCLQFFPNCPQHSRYLVG